MTDRVTPARMRRWPEPCLMLVTDCSRLRGRTLEEVASLAVDGGVTVVQLRENDLPTRELYDLAITLRAVLRGRGLLLVNDRVDVALAAGADGVQLPERGLPARAVREIAGEACVLGRSVHSFDAAVRAEAEGADFVLAGTIYTTASKPGQTPAGVELVRAAVQAVPVPVVAIGGVTAENAGELIEAGAGGVAVIGAIMDADDPKQAAAELRNALDAAVEGRPARPAGGTR